jgi:two-component system response regulator HydG
MHLVTGLSSLVAVIEDAEDDQAVLEGACRWLREECGATAAAVIAIDRGWLGISHGWHRGDLSGEIAGILDGPAGDLRHADHDRSATAFGVSIRYGGHAVGLLVIRGPADRLHTLRESAMAVAALCGSALRGRLDALQASESSRDAVPEIVGQSPLVRAVRQAVARAASTPFPVLIEGESGTGKELVARALHRLSSRRDRRFSAVNCAALTDELVEAELFGHAKGAFTGAVGPRAGLFEEAHGSSLFLDEVAELSPRAQAKLLRAIQEREIRRVGENVARPVDVRLIAASNVSLAGAVAQGQFRNDLRYRLAVIKIQLPPLRERPEDVPVLARLFWGRAIAEAGTKAMLAPDALLRLTRHSWRGNVRELQNVISALVVTAPPRGRVTARHVDQVLAISAGSAEAPGVPLEAARRTFERRIVAAALARNAGKRSEAASELGLTRQGLTKAIRRLGLGLDKDAAGVA